jgi:hypothetical protein
MMTMQNITENQIFSITSAIPKSVLNEYEANNGKPSKLVIAQPSDLTPESMFGQQWVLIDEYDIRVISTISPQQANQKIKIPLQQIQNARIEPCVGNALLEVTVQEKPEILLHFSNELTENFVLIVNYLRQFMEPKNNLTIPEFNVEGKCCISCGRKLLDPSLKVCPSCIKRGQVMRRMLWMARPFWKQGAIHIALMLLLPRSMSAGYPGWLPAC